MNITAKEITLHDLENAQYGTPIGMGYLLLPSILKYKVH